MALNSLEDELVTVNNLIPSHSSRKAHQSMRRHAAVVPPLVVYKASELSLARAAGFVMVAFPFVGTLARFIAFRITSGLPVPGGHGGTPRGRARRIEDIAVACREVWPRLDECLTMFDRCLGKAGVALHRWNNFSAPNWIANLKLGIMLLFAVIHGECNEARCSLYLPNKPKSER